MQTSNNTPADFAVTTLRHATPSDAMALADLAEMTFRDTFAATNTVEDMNLHCRSKYGEAIQLAEIADPAIVTLLLERDAKLLAYAQLRWGVPPACVVARLAGEIQRFYLDAAWHGKGLAPLLMERCLTEIQRREADVAWLRVWEQNPKAIAFYRKFGFAEVGNHVFPLGRDLQRDIIMARTIAGW